MNSIMTDTFVELVSAVSTSKIIILTASGFTIILSVVLFFFIRRIVERNRTERELLSVIKRLVGQNGDIYHLIDIRDSEIFKTGHLPTAINVPYKEIDQFFPTEKMFTRIIVCGDNSSEVKKAARGLSDRAYFRVDTLCRLSRWDGEWETGEGLSLTDFEGERKDEVQ